MNKISISDIKKLRGLSGAGFLDCKEALDNSGADIDKAIDFLRKKGISIAQKSIAIVKPKNIWLNIVIIPHKN